MRNSMLSVYSAIIILCLTVCSDAYHNVPPDRRIESVEGQTYQFGIVEDLLDNAITNCAYQTDTGENGSFEVLGSSSFSNRQATVPVDLQNPQVYEERADYNIIRPLGHLGFCQIAVDNVNSTGPKIWNLTATNNRGNLLQFSTFDVSFFYSSPILSSQMDLMEGGSFYNHLLLNNINLTSCKLRAWNIELDMNLQSAQTPNNAEEATKRLKSLGEGICGFRLANVSFEGENDASWTLSAGDESGLFYRGSFESLVNNKRNDTRDSVHEGILGTHAVLECGTECVDDFCTLINPAGTIVSNRNCTLEVDNLLMEHVGVWRCYCQDKNAMEGLEYTLDVIGKNFAFVETWQTESDDYLNIGCRMANSQGNDAWYCLMTAPNKRIYNVRPSLATDRYLALGTDLGRGICSLEIQKPLELHERGQWKCEILLRSSEAAGALIKTAEVPMPEYPKYLKISTQLGRSFTISCEIPYSSPYCSITAPNGSITVASRAEATLGRCSLTVKEANSTDKGNWICSFGRETGLVDDRITVEVAIAEVLTFPEKVEIDANNNAHLLCESGGHPLLYCRFMSPTGRSYYIPNRQNSSIISYYGAGYEYGDCGITITNVQVSDKGLWTCYARLSYGKTSMEAKAQILVDVTSSILDGPNVAGIGIGVAVGVVVVSTVVGVVAINRWKRRNHEEVVGISRRRRSNDDDTSSNNSETVFSRGPSVRTYTNPQPVEVEMERSQYNII